MTTPHPGQPQGSGWTPDAPSPRRPPAARPALWRVISLAVALFATPIAIGMMLTGAAVNEPALRSTGEPNSTGIFLIVAGAAIIAAIACTAFWSSMGIVVEGAIVYIVGLIGSVVPSGLRAEPFFTAEIIASAENWVRAGTPLVLGGLLLVVGGVASVARRRMTRGPAVPLVR